MADILHQTVVLLSAVETIELFACFSTDAAVAVKVRAERTHEQ